MALIAFRELSGRDLARAYESAVGSTISYGTLYTTLRRMSEKGWVKCRDDEDQDGRIRFFELSTGGREVLREAREHFEGLARFGSLLRPASS